jgi:hypothetical protein
MADDDELQQMWAEAEREYEERRIRVRREAWARGDGSEAISVMVGWGIILDVQVNAESAKHFRREAKEMEISFAEYVALQFRHQIRQQGQRQIRQLQKAKKRPVK